MVPFVFWASIFTGFVCAIAAANASSVDVSLAVFIEVIGVIGMTFGLILANILNEARLKSK